MEELETVDEKLNNDESTVNSVDTKKRKRIIINILIVAISNLIKLLAGILIAFVIPGTMGTEQYGFYKTYILYLGYVGLFHFGFIDGIYLIYAGVKYNSLNKLAFRRYTRVLLFIESAIAFIGIFISLFILNTNGGYLLLFISASALVTNIITYYQYISQVTERFLELSIVNTAQAVLEIVVVSFFVIMQRLGYLVLDYRLFVLVWFLMLSSVAIFYVIRYRDITFGKCNSLKMERRNILKFFAIGFPLMIASFAASVILTFDKQFVRFLVDFKAIIIDDFGIFAFAYTSLQVVLTVISAISTVLYPTIKNYSEDKLKNDYNKLIAIIAILTSFCLLVYQPLCFIVERFLPQYVDSLPILRAIIPSVIFTSCVTMIMFNYYKREGKNLKFFIISIIILGLAIGADYLAYYLSHELYWISQVSVMVLGIWYLVSDFFIAKRFRIKTFKNIIYIALIVASYYLVTAFVLNIYISFALYFVIFAILTILFYFKYIKNKFIS